MPLPTVYYFAISAALASFDDQYEIVEYDTTPHEQILYWVDNNNESSIRPTVEKVEAYLSGLPLTFRLDDGQETTLTAESWAALGLPASAMPELTVTDTSARIRCPFAGAADKVYRDGYLWRTNDA